MSSGQNQTPKPTNKYAIPPPTTSGYTNYVLDEVSKMSIQTGQPWLEIQAYYVHSTAQNRLDTKSVLKARLLNACLTTGNNVFMVSNNIMAKLSEKDVELGNSKNPTFKHSEFGSMMAELKAQGWIKELRAPQKTGKRMAGLYELLLPGCVAYIQDHFTALLTQPSDVGSTLGSQLSTTLSSTKDYSIKNKEDLNSHVDELVDRYRDCNGDLDRFITEALTLPMVEPYQLSVQLTKKLGLSTKVAQSVYDRYRNIKTGV